jgi:hypothetical protein
MTHPQSETNPEFRTAYTALSVRPTSNRREYAVTFIQAGRVKQRDQDPAPWEIPDTTLQQAVPLATGRAVFIDHAPDNFFAQELPSLHNLVGITSSAHWNRKTAAICGTIQLYDRDDTNWVAQLLDQIAADQAAGRPTPDIGLSLVFFGRHTSIEKGGERLKRTDHIKHIESIDLVFGPAANGRVHHALSVKGHALSTKGATQMPEEREPYNTDPEEETPPGTDTTTTQPPLPRGEGGIQPPQPTIDPTALMTHLDALNARIERLASATAGLVEGGVVKGMGIAPVRPPIATQRPRPTVQGMWSGLDRLTAAYEALMGLTPKIPYEKLTGIRELYMLLSGDRALTGNYNPDLAMLAYSDSGNNADTTTMAELTRNVMNKALVQQVDFLQEYRWWERVSHIQDFNSLQQISWVRIGGVGDIPTVAEKAEYTQLAWDDARLTADWAKKGGYLPLSLEMIDRDDVEAWRSVPRQLATAALVTLSGIVSALFTDNSGVGPSITTEGSTAYAFSSTWGNLITQPLTYENWQTAIESMYKLKQLNVNDRRTAVRPKFLLVPVELEAQAISVVTSDRRPGSNFNDRVPVKRMLPEENVITVPHWTDAGSWACLADPNICPFIGIGFRYGRTPELFTASDPNTHLLFTNDVLPIKVRWFFAVSVIDPRGAVKSNA